MEIEDYNLQHPLLSSQEQVVVNLFERNYSKDGTCRFIVPLPMKNDVTTLRESRSLVVKWFKALERSLRGRSQSKEFADTVQEYFNMGHEELVPVTDLSKPCNEVYYLPMHTLHKETSSTSKVWVMFEAFAKTASGTSLNDHLFLKPTVHPMIIDVVLRF